jgi:hypothetical protein
MTRLPSRVAAEMQDTIDRKADEFGYLTRNRVENGQFLEQMVAEPTVGGRLIEYMDISKVKTYIKDKLLNQYSKKHRPLPRDIKHILAPTHGESLVEIKYWNEDHVSLHRANETDLLLVARIAFNKWETGLRKLVMYAPQFHGSKQEKEILRLILIIFLHGNSINGADRANITKGLNLLGVESLWEE